MEASATTQFSAAQVNERNGTDGRTTVPADIGRKTPVSHRGFRKNTQGRFQICSARGLSFGRNDHTAAVLEHTAGAERFSTAAAPLEKRSLYAPAATRTGTDAPHDGHKASPVAEQTSLERRESLARADRGPPESDSVFI